MTAMIAMSATWRRLAGRTAPGNHNEIPTSPTEHQNRLVDREDALRLRSTTRALNPGARINCSAGHFGSWEETMRRAALVLAFVLVATLAVLAQGRGGGRPSGASGGNLGGPSGVSVTEPSSANHGHGEDANTMDANTHAAGPKTPDELLNQNTKLASKLDSMLPKGTTAQQACSGFKNLGQCVAAIHVSPNLGISFDDLKTKMTGSGESLGKAIHDLKPDVNAKAEAKKGEKQADEDLQESAS